MNKEELQNIIEDAKVILDIGSCSGSDGYELHNLFQCPIHCFEPNKHIFFNRHGLIHYPVAVGSRNGLIDFWIPENHEQSSSVFEPKEHIKIWPDIQFKKSKNQVECVTLDRWYEVNKKEHPIIDFIWCDVNGAEFDVIVGALKMLKHVRYMYIEVSNIELYAGQRSANEIISLLDTLKWKVHSLHKFDKNYGNILFKNTKVKL